MSHENVDLVERAFEAINRRDVDGFLELAAPGVVQDWSRAVGPQSGLYRGPAEVAQFLRSWWDAFDESTIVVDELVDAGEQVVAVFHGRQRGRASGVEVEGRGAVLVWSLRDGKIDSATLYQGRDEALEAAGLAVVVKQFEDTNAHRFADVVDAWTDDVTLVLHGKLEPFSNGATGKAAVRDWFVDWFRQFGPDYRFEIEETRVSGDRVFLLATHHGHGRRSGVTVEQRTAYVYTVHQGKVIRVEVWPDEDREAALRESRRGDSNP